MKRQLGDYMGPPLGEDRRHQTLLGHERRGCPTPKGPNLPTIGGLPLVPAPGRPITSQDMPCEIFLVQILIGQ